MKEYDKLLTKNTTQIESDRKITKNENMPLKINFEYNKSKSLDKQLQVLNTEPITSNHFKLNDINEKKQNTEVYYNMTDVNQDVNNLERYNKPLTSKIFYKKTSPIIIDNKSDKKTLSRNENEITIISHTKNTTNIENENLLLEEEKKFIVDISEKILLNAAKIKGKAFKPSSNFPCSYFYNEQFYYSLIKFLFPSFHINSANNIYVFEEKQNIFYMIENNDNYCANFNDSLYNLKQTIIFLESLTEISLANINPEKLIKERSYYSIKSLLEFIYDLTQIMLDYDCSALVDNYNVKINDNIESNLIEVNFDHIDHHDSNEVKVFEDSSKGNTFLQSINKNFYDHVGQNSLCFQEDEKSKKFENSKRLNTESNPNNYLFSFGNNHLTNGPNNSSIKEKSSQNEFDNNQKTSHVSIYFSKFKS